MESRLVLDVIMYALEEFWRKHIAVNVTVNACVWVDGDVIILNLLSR